MRKLNSALQAVGKLVRQKLELLTPWTNVYGIARTVLAIGTILTLLLNDSSTLFHLATGLPEVPVCRGVQQGSLFCLLSENLDLARYVAIVLLVVVASGWRPRVTGILHWWVAASFLSTATVVDGGDQVTAVLTFLLLPVTLTDTRRWHWNPYADETQRNSAKLIAWSSFTAIRLQIAGLYFQAFAAKLRVSQWINGTAFYYWSDHSVFGSPMWLSPVLDPVSETALVVPLTWGALIVEFLLAAGIIVNPHYRKPLLIVGLLFHAFIALLHGLVSFTIAMNAALVLYLWPFSESFQLNRLLSYLEMPFRGSYSPKASEKSRL